MNIGGIEGRVKLVVGDEEFGLGTVYVPLKVTRALTGNSDLTLGIAADKGQIRREVERLFRADNTERDDQ